MFYFWLALGLLFIALKLTHHIDWSWWWVLLPVYGPFTVTAVLMLCVAIYRRWFETPQDRAARLLLEMSRKLDRRR